MPDEKDRNAEAVATFYLLTRARQNRDRPGQLDARDKLEHLGYRVRIAQAMTTQRKEAKQ